MHDDRVVRPLIVFALIATVSCSGKSSEQSQDGRAQVQQGAETMADGAKEMAKGIETLGKGLAEMASDADIKPVEPVSFRELQTIFPEMPGWERGKPTGEKMSAPVSFSQAEVKYTNGGSSIEAKVVDSGFNKLLMAPFAMFLTTGYEKETESGYEKSVKVGDHPGWEKWDGEGRDGELNVVINKRFLVSLEGDDLADTSVLYELARRADFAKLGAIK